MKKNGFTLIELLAVIVVLIIITTIAMAAYKGIKVNIDKKSYDNLVSYIENVSEEYAIDNGIIGVITVQDLIDDGYITPDDKDNIYNQVDNSKLNCNKIIITYDEEKDIYSSKLTNDIQQVDANNKCNADFVQLYEMNQYVTSYELKLNANIILLLDVSNSMKDVAEEGSTKTRLDVEKEVVNNLAEDLFNNPMKNIKMALIKYSNKAEIVLGPTDSLSTFKSKINTLQADGGTNWEAALQQALNVSFGNNYPTYVIFVSDGVPTFRLTKGDYNPMDDYFYATYGVYGNGTDEEDRTGVEALVTVQRCYDHAKDDAKAIVDKGYKFYTIGAYGDIDRMKSLTTDAGSSIDNYYAASNASELTDAFKNILTEVIDVELNGRTYLSQEGMILLGTVNITNDKPLNVFDKNELIYTITSLNNEYIVNKDNNYYFDITKFAKNKNISIKNINIKYYNA